MRIRNEDMNDLAAIRRVNYQAFKDHPQHKPGAEPTEHRIVDELRASHSLALSLVAEDEDGVMGHIAMSRAQVGQTGDWYLLGPVSVMPGRQNQGVGSALIREALSRMRGQGADGVVLVGDPGFYGRFGFASITGLTYAGVPHQFVLGLAFDHVQPQGAIRAHEAFYAG